MEIEEEVLKANAFREFNPLQCEALRHKWRERSIVVSSPTASGKTVLAELCALNSIIEKSRKVVYTCPLRALASEHYRDFRKKYSKGLGIRAAISTGDFDSSGRYLGSYDIIYTTYEKLDSLIRHRPSWIQELGLLVVDEIHEIDSGRGPVLEMVITKLRQLNPALQILALSATIANARELAAWLDAELVSSDYRPVKLVEAVYLDGVLFYGGGSEEITAGEDAVTALVLDTLEKGKQALVFANTRKCSESIARRVAPLVAGLLSKREKASLDAAAEKALNVLETPTEQCRAVHSLIRQGVCFHNAGLMQRQREIVEDLFRENRLKVVAATPTLSLGVNFPAYRVIIPTLYRYTASGNRRISVREYKQLAGRGGRPKYDSLGQSVLLARSDEEKDELFDSYINGTVEDIKSQLGIEPVLRTHVLASVAAGFVNDAASMEAFFSRTFYAAQYAAMDELFEKINGMLVQLEEMGLVEQIEGRLGATLLGARVSELYLDPLSAHKIILALKKAASSEIYWLYMLSDSFEFSPHVSVSRKREAELWELLQQEKGFLPVDVEREMFSDPDLLAKFNTALMLRRWIGEASEESIMEEFNIQPGILYGKLQIADWLAYSASELARLLGFGERLLRLDRLRKRLKSGIKEELIPICEVRGIGRVRGRRLWRSNVRSVAELKKIDVMELSRILGKGVAAKIKKELGQA